MLQIPCVICCKDEFETKCDNWVTVLIGKLCELLPYEIVGCKLRPELRWRWDAAIRLYM